MRILLEVFDAAIINHELVIYNEGNPQAHSHESLPQEIREIEDETERVIKAAQLISAENEANKRMKKRVNKEGDKFPIILKKLVE